MSPYRDRPPRIALPFPALLVFLAVVIAFFVTPTIVGLVAWWLR